MFEAGSGMRAGVMSGSDSTREEPRLHTGLSGLSIDCNVAAGGIFGQRPAEDPSLLHYKR